MQHLDFKYLRRAPMLGTRMEKDCSDRFLQCWNALHASGHTLPPNLVADLLFAGHPEFTRIGILPGARFEGLPDAESWSRWVHEQWRPWTDGSFASEVGDHGCLEKLADRFGVENTTTDPSRELARWGALLHAGFDRLWKLEEWGPRGGRLRKAVRGRNSLHELIGLSTVLRSRSGAGQFDRRLSTGFSRYEGSSGEARLVGTHGEGEVDEVVRRPHGTFREQAIGPVPRNFGNLSPVELAYLGHERARLLFQLHVANSTLDQRFFESSITSDQRALVHVEVVLEDAFTLHQWSERRPPAITHYRACLVAILAELVRAHDPLRVELRLHAGYTDLARMDCIKPLDLTLVHQHAEQGMDHLALHLGSPDLLPDLFREAPFLFRESAPATDPDRSSDRVVRIRLSADEQLDYAATHDLQIVMHDLGHEQDPHWIICHPGGRSQPEPRQEMLTSLAARVYNQAGSRGGSRRIALDFRS